MTRRFAAALGMLASIAVLAPSHATAQELQGREGSRFTWSERVPAGQWLRVYGVNGRVDVVEASGDAAEVVGEKVVRGRGRVEDIAFDIRRSSDGVTICAIIDSDTECDDRGIRHRGRWNHDDDDTRVNFTVRVPRGVKIGAHSGNGSVRVEGVSAEVHAASGNGDVSVATSGGPVQASSGNGEVRVARAGGPVRASSGNGRVTVLTARGPVNASSGNGNVEVVMDAIADVADDMELSSGNGTISVTVPAEFDAEIDAGTGSGRIYSDFPMTLRGRIDPRHVRATIGRGGRRLTMRSGNGDVELKKK